MKKYIVTVNGNKYEVEVEETGVSRATSQGTSVISEVKEEVKISAPQNFNVSAGQKTIKAPMPGTIIDVRISQGQRVKKGDVLFILEAMKMENEIMAGEEGNITNIAVARGATVSTDDVLATLE